MRVGCEQVVGMSQVEIQTGRVLNSDGSQEPALSEVEGVGGSRLSYTVLRGHTWPVVIMIMCKLL